MPRHKKTDSEFKCEVYDLVGNEYVFLDSYVKATVKLRVKHNTCGNIYEVSPNNFFQGSRCPMCYVKARRKTNDQFKQEIYALVGNEYTFLDSYLTTDTKIRVKHNKCGNIYKVSPNKFIHGRRCPLCYGNIKKTDADFKKEIFALAGDEYTFLEPYINAHTKLRVKHNKCGNIYSVEPAGFIYGYRCPFCATNSKKANDQFKEDVYLQVGNDYTFLDPYAGNKTKLRVRHNECGNIYKVRPNDFLNCHSRCPYCNSPKGELIIAKILDTLNINYETQKKFDDLRDDRLLSYDFYILDQNILIEYQGQQHYQPVDIFGGRDQFKIQQRHDQMKADYAKTNNYNLITIPYTEDTFSKIKKYLIKHGLKKR